MPEETDLLTTSMISCRHEITIVRFQFRPLRFQPLLFDWIFIRSIHAYTWKMKLYAYTTEEK